MGAQFMWFAFGAFTLGCLVVVFVSHFKGDFRAGCETPWGKFFVEAKERSKKLEKKTKKALT